MNYKKKSILIIIIIVICIQILLLINNRQKTSLRYFIWKVEGVTIGRLISISFISGSLISTFLNFTLNNEVRIYQKDEEKDKSSFDYENTFNNNERNESHEMPPERDLRETQPTISVNYRVIKDNGENKLNDRNQKSRDSQYQDDWNNNNSEW